MSKGFHKKQSKRMLAKRRYKIEKKVRDHKKKLKKQEKLHKHKVNHKDPGIPNSLPFKDKVIKEFRGAMKKEKSSRNELREQMKKIRQNGKEKEFLLSRGIYGKGDRFFLLKKQIVDAAKANGQSVDNDHSEVDLEKDYVKASTSGSSVTNAKNNKAAINRKLKEIELKYDWFETLVTSPTSETLPNDQVDHDFNREMHFYRQAQASVLESLKRIHSLNIPTKRPDDYFAEMAKSDKHMLQVKKALSEREAVLAKIEKFKKHRKEKQFGKMKQNQMKVSKIQEKKELNKKVARYQQGKEKSLDFLNDGPKKEGKPVKKMTKKALHKKKVYGRAGGQKKRSKYNTAESSAEVSHFKKGKPKANKRKYKSN